MRTKTLLLSVALGAASIAAVMAQTTPVYSVNIVGYVNKQIPAGYSLIANPLKVGTGATANTLVQVLPTAPDGAVIYKWKNAANTFQDGITYFEGEWSKVNATDDDVLAPGEGAFIYVDSSSYPTGATLTFVGEVSTGALSQNIPLNYSIQSSQVPQSVDLSTIGFPAMDGDVLYFWDSSKQTYNDAVTYFEGWDKPAVPGIAEAFFVYKGPDSAAQTWSRTFNVN